MAPVYTYAKRRRSKVREEYGSKVSNAVAALPLRGKSGRSEIVVPRRNGSVRALKSAQSTLPTLKKSPSGVHRFRDAVGVRRLCALEEGALHGVPQRYLHAMVDAALLHCKTDATVVAAIGDGFSVGADNPSAACRSPSRPALPFQIHVVRDIVRNALRACGFGL